MTKTIYYFDVKYTSPTSAILERKKEHIDFGTIDQKYKLLSTILTTEIENTYYSIPEEFVINNNNLNINKYLKIDIPAIEANAYSFLIIKHILYQISMSIGACVVLYEPAIRYINHHCDRIAIQIFEQDFFENKLFKFNLKLKEIDENVFSFYPSA